MLIISSMPPRISPPSKAISSILRCKKHRQYATAAVLSTSTVQEPSLILSPPKIRFPSTQPPSYKPPEFRKTQLLRQYASLLRSSPLMLLFQHNNLKSAEWIGVRRELSKALQKVDEARVAAGHPAENLADQIQLQIVQVGIFGAALRVVEFYTPEGDGLTHTLSEAAHEAAVKKRKSHALQPLLSGPLAVLTFPNVSPLHLKAALSHLSPSPPGFPAPTRKANPGWHDPQVQGGLQKLLLVAARVEGKVFDVERTRWIGGIEGGLEGLQAQLVAVLQSLGSGLTNTLEGAGKSLYLTVDGRRTMLEDETKGPSGQELKEEAEA
jgi:large subunit ribosomal protein L10